MVEKDVAGDKPQLQFADAALTAPREISGPGGSMTVQLASEIGRTGNADRMLGGQSNFELVAGTAEGSIVRVQSGPDIQQSIQTMRDAALKGGDWGAAADVWKKVFQSESEVPNTTPDNVARGLNMVGAAMNRQVKPLLEEANRNLKPGESPRLTTPIGMAAGIGQDDKVYYYMMNSRDQAALDANKAAIAADIKGTSGAKLPGSVIKLGPFEPGQRT